MSGPTCGRVVDNGERESSMGYLRVVLFDLIFFYIHFTCICYLHVCPRILFMSGTCGGQKYASDSLELVTSHHVGAGKQTQVL